MLLNCRGPNGVCGSDKVFLHISRSGEAVVWRRVSFTIVTTVLSVTLSLFRFRVLRTKRRHESFVVGYNAKSVFTSFV